LDAACLEGEAHLTRLEVTCIKYCLKHIEEEAAQVEDGSQAKVEQLWEEDGGWICQNRGGSFGRENVWTPSTSFSSQYLMN
jgi:hypothetical protein